MNNHSTELTNKEIFRYSRQLIIPEFGIKGQSLLKSSKALVVGCGGLGCPAAIYLAAAGIGTLGLLDYDSVDLTNLHRQILHKEAGVDTPKCESAKTACEQINSNSNYIVHHMSLSSTNAIDIISQYDVVLDCTDNVATRYLLNDACVITNKPLISGAALKFEGQLTVYNYNGGPCYRCLYPSPPPPSAVTNCSEGGVLGVTPGIIGTMQAQEAIKLISKMEGVLAGRLFLYDGLSFSTRIVRLRPKQPNCSVCGDNPSVTQLIDYTEFCGTQPNDKSHSVCVPGLKRVTAEQYKRDYLDGSRRHVLIDTRPKHEVEICSLPNSFISNILKMDKESIKNHELFSSDELNDRAVVFVCHHGNDSQIASDHVKHLLEGNQVTDIIARKNSGSSTLFSTTARSGSKRSKRRGSR